MLTLIYGFNSGGRRRSSRWQVFFEERPSVRHDESSPEPMRWRDPWLRLTAGTFSHPDGTLHTFTLCSWVVFSSHFGNLLL